MLELANANSNDVIYDLGCGDGRILFMAVEEFGVKKAVGYELNTSMVKTLKHKIESNGFQDVMKVVNGNFFGADLTPATLVTLYLTTSGNSKLRPKFKDELRIGARIVSHDFPIRGWTTLKPKSPDHYSFGSHKIYLYMVPEAYETNASISRSPAEDSTWKRIREIFLRLDGRR